MWRADVAGQDWGLGIGDWGLGTGDWGLGIADCGVAVPGLRTEPFHKRLLDSSAQTHAAGFKNT
jgi:hypothetical protein